MEDSDSDYEKEDIRPRGLTGLQNLGNTCYLNSALQSLSNCPPLTQYFLDCEQLIRSEKSPGLSKSYLKLVTELWHKKRPSYVVPSGIVSGIKAVHPMFRGFTQQDAQEFLRCLMDQLHEELKMPVVLSDDSDEDNDDDDEDDKGEEEEDESSDDNNVNNTNNAASEEQHPSLPDVNKSRRPSCDSTSSQEEEDYETCDSGHSSESCSNSGRDISSGDENGNGSGGEEVIKEAIQQEIKRSRKLSALSVGSGTEEYYTPALDMVANTKEMKETANLLERRQETETRKGKMFMEGGDSKEQGGLSAGSTVVVGEAPQTTAATTADAGVGGGASTTTTTTTTTVVDNAATASPTTVSSTAPRDGGECQSVESTKPAAATSSSPAAAKPNRKPRKPPNVRYDSIISQTFDGKILSSVRCLNCETVSTTKETFQDLSLPIPSKDHLHMLHSGYPSMTGGGVNPPKGGACGEVNQGWLSSVLSWMKSWFVGPTVTLQDCLAAFFSADELKGDNMYSCGKCKKLRNGLKYSKVLDLPEILSIHLKRFRHEFYSSKINTYISFPLEGLNMEPYADKDCQNEVTTYDLVAIICHHGTAGGGHYTAYCLNHLNSQWYEFDDQFVTEVDVNQVMNCEAYVLFYRKSNKKIEPIRQKIYEAEADERASILKFYISRPWFSRFHTFAEPGPITNMDFLCKHGGVPPAKVPLLDHLIYEVPQDTWEILYNRFGGGMVCNHLFACKVCQNELQRIKQRQKSEREVFIKLNEEFQADEYSGPVFAISMAWFRQWEGFARERYDSPPEAVDNSNISIMRNGQPVLRQNSDHGHLSRDMWQFLVKIYGGGPEILFRNSTGAVMKTSSNSSPVPAPTTTASAPIATTISSVSCSSPPPTFPHQQQQQQLQNKPTLASIAAAASASGSSSCTSTSLSSSLSSSSASSASFSSSTTSYSLTTSSSYASSSSSSSMGVPMQSPCSPNTSTATSVKADNTAASTSNNKASTPPTTLSDSGLPLGIHTSQNKQKATSKSTLSQNDQEIHQQNQANANSPPSQTPVVEDGKKKSNYDNTTTTTPNKNQLKKAQTNDTVSHTNPSHCSSSSSLLSGAAAAIDTHNEKPDDPENIDKNSFRGKTETEVENSNSLPESQDSAISCHSTFVNEDLTESGMTSSTTSIVSNGKHSSSGSRDSGISSEASPISEDQMAGVEDGNTGSDGVGVGMGSSGTTNADDIDGVKEEGGRGGDRTRQKNGKDTSLNVARMNEASSSSASASGVDNCNGKDGGVVVVGGGGKPVKAATGTTTNSGGGGSGKGRNRKKKNKNMEVTRI